MAYRCISLLLLLCVCLASFSCGQDDSTSNSDDDLSPSDDDSSPSIDDDDTALDDDTSPDDDATDDDDDDDDDNDDDTTPSPTTWCTGIGTVSPEPGWVWEKRELVQVPTEFGNPFGFVQFDGEVLWVLWIEPNEPAYIWDYYLARLDGDEWTQWHISNFPERDLDIVGLAVDEDGGVWTTAWDPQHLFFDVTLNVVRWVDGEIVESKPVADSGLTGFGDLLILPDGRFVITYSYGGFRILEERPDGTFAQKLFGGGLLDYAVGPDNLLHQLSAGYEQFWYLHGSPINGFSLTAHGTLPAQQMYQSPIGVTSDGVVTYSPFMEDKRLYLVQYDGIDLSVQTWTPSPLIRWVAPFAAAGVDQHDRPYAVISTKDYEDAIFCYLNWCEDGIRAEVIEQSSTWWWATFHDSSTSPNQQVAVLAGQVEDGHHLTIYNRTNQNRKEQP